MATYVIARTGRGRPTLQHRLQDTEGHVHLTACGVEVDDWSRAYQASPIPQVLCIRCRKSDR